MALLGNCCHFCRQLLAQALSALFHTPAAARILFRQGQGTLHVFRNGNRCQFSFAISAAHKPLLNSFNHTHTVYFARVGYPKELLGPAVDAGGYAKCVVIGHWPQKSELRGYERNAYDIVPGPDDSLAEAEMRKKA